jgi:hypothetical protein
MSCVGVMAMSMAMVGTSYIGNIQWSILTRILFFCSFFGFIIPGWDSDIWAAAAVIGGFLATPQAWRSMVGCFTFRRHRSNNPAGKGEDRCK